MVYREAARKTGAYMLVSALLGLGVLTFLTEDLSSPAGRVTSPAVEVAGSNWLVFALGIFMGCLIVGGYFYIAHVERPRG